MLQKIHESRHGLPSKIFLGLIVAVMGLFGFGAFDVFVSSQPAVATVNGVDIETAEFTRLLRDQRQALEDASIDDQQLQQMVLDGLIQRALLLQQGDANAMAVTERMLAERISSEPAFQADGTFSEDLLRQILNAKQLTAAQFRQVLSEDLLVTQIRQGLMGSDFVTRDELRKVTSLANQKRDVAWITIGVADMANNVEVTDADAQRFFEDNPALFQSPERVAVDFVRLSRDSVASDIVISDDELAAAYERRKNDAEQRRAAHIQLQLTPERTLEQAQAQLLDLRAKVADAASFNDLARQHSEDLGSKEAGGDLGFLRKGFGEQTPAWRPLESALWTLEPGQVSDPVVTADSVHLIMDLEHRTLDIPPFEDAKEQLRADALQPKIDEAFATKRQALAEAAYDMALADVAKEFTLTVQRTEAFARSGGTAESADPAFVVGAFDEDFQVSDANSGVIDLADGSAVVMHFVERNDAAALEFAQAREAALAAVTRERAAALASKEADSVVAALNGGATAQEAAVSRGLSVREQAQVGRNAAGTEVPAEVASRLFQLARPANGGRQVAQTRLADGSPVVLILTKVSDGNTVDEGPEFNAYGGYFKTVNGQRQFASYLNQLKATADIETNMGAL